MSQDEQYNKTIDVWSKASEEVTHRHAGRAEPAQPGLHDGDLGRARFDRAGQAARRYARTDVRPVGPHSRDPGQGFAQRRPDRPRVLHLDARRAQGSRRHRAAHGRLGLPDAASGRRCAGRDRPRGRLRHAAGDHGLRHRASARKRSSRSTTASSAAAPPRTSKIPRTSASQDRPARRRDRRREGQGDHRRGHPRSEDPLRPDLPGEVRRLRDVLRPQSRDRQARRHRRGGRHHRRAVDR